VVAVRWPSREQVAELQRRTRRLHSAYAQARDWRRAELRAERQRIIRRLARDPDPLMHTLAVLDRDHRRVKPRDACSDRRGAAVGSKRTKIEDWQQVKLVQFQRDSTLFLLGVLAQSFGRLGTYVSTLGLGRHAGAAFAGCS